MAEPDTSAGSAVAVVEAPEAIVIHGPRQGTIDDEEWDRLAAVGSAAVAPAAVPALPESVPVVPPATAVLPSGERKRASSLDALRGLFLISMTLGFSIEYEQLPLWMYHRQLPPPGAVPVDVAGISWRDLAYAAFLFTMAAALPITQSRRVERGDTELAIIGGLVRRYWMLLVFALLAGHSNTFFLGYTQVARVLALAGFVIMALLFTRRRADWSEARYRVARRVGWVLAILFIAATPAVLGRPWTIQPVDDIIVDLAFASVVGGSLWYFTRDNLGVRFGALALAVVLYLGARQDGWVQRWWYGSPFPWAFLPSQLSLLTVVVPGTIIGDLVVRWMRDPTVIEGAGVSGGKGWSAWRGWMVVAVTAAITPLVVVGLYQRAVGWTTAGAFALLTVGLIATWSPNTSTERMVRSILGWGGFWLMLGLLLDPFEGGIKKEPETLSYFFTVAGTTATLLVATTALMELLGRRRAAAVLVDVGQNPLLMYVLFTVCLSSLFGLLPPLRDLLQGSAVLSLTRSVLTTVLVVAIIRLVTRRRIYWRT